MHLYGNSKTKHLYRPADTTFTLGLRCSIYAC